MFIYITLCTDKRSQSAVQGSQKQKQSIKQTKVTMTGEKVIKSTLKDGALKYTIHKIKRSNQIKSKT